MTDDAATSCGIEYKTPAQTLGELPFRKTRTPLCSSLRTRGLCISEIIPEVTAVQNNKAAGYPVRMR